MTSAGADNDKTVIAARSGGRVSPGVRLNGIYEIDSLVGAGGMSEIYRGHNVQTLDKVAIKVILPQYAVDEQIISLFRREALILNRLSHESIIRYHVFSHDAPSDLLYLAMEYVEGPTLRERIAQRPLSQFEACQLIAKVAAGMRVAHSEGVVHRDLSTDNIILSNGDVSKPKVIDFGIARSGEANDSTLIETGFAGKYNYVAPEQLGLYGGNVGPAADIYSLGLVFAAALRGRPLDMAGTQADVVLKRQAVPDLSQINPGVKPLIERMLQPNPLHRIQNMDDVLATLEMTLGVTRESTTGRMPRVSAVTPLPREERRSGSLGAFALLAACLAAVASVGWWAIETGRLSTKDLPLLAEVTRQPAPAPVAEEQGKSEVRAQTDEAAAAPPATEQAAAPAQPPEDPPSVAEGGTPIPEPTPALEPEAPAAGAEPPAVNESPAPTEVAAAPSRPRINLGGDRSSAPEQPGSAPDTGPRSTDSISGWITRFDGGDCFYARPIRVAANGAQVEGFAQTVQPLETLHNDFQAAYGFEPEIRMRPLEMSQCAVVGLASSNLSSSRIKLDLDLDLLGARDELQARVFDISQPNVAIFVVDPEGKVRNLNASADADGREIAVKFPAKDLRPDKRGYLVLALAADKPLPMFDADGQPAAAFVASLRKEAAEQGATLETTFAYFRRQ